MDGGQVLHRVQADPEDAALGNEVAPNMHVPVGQPICAGACWVHAQRFLHSQIQHLQGECQAAVFLFVFFKPESSVNIKVLLVTRVHSTLTDSWHTG